MQLFTQINKYSLLFSAIFMFSIGLGGILENHIIFTTVSYFGAMFIVLVVIKKDFTNLQTEKTYLATKLKQHSVELQNALEQLELAKQQLIQTEKMAALGRETADIIHEINTPLGVISSSISITKMFSEQILEQLPLIINLSNESAFIELIKRSAQNLLSNKEERELKNIIAKQLNEYSITNNVTIANYLVSMGIYNGIETLLHLLRSSDNVKIFKIAYKIAALKTIILTNSTAIDKAIKIITAINFYGNNSSQTTNIIDNIETILTLYHNKTKQGVEIIRNYSNLPPIMCYPNELGQVWTNLIHNALHAMNYQGILQLDVQLQNSNVCVSISDNGIGISDEIKDKIFEPFFTTKSADEGNGLGLDIVKKIIEKHNGKITVNSKPGQTVFRVSIPAQ